MRSYFIKIFWHSEIYFIESYPLAGQGFNMTIRDINLNDIIQDKIDLGLHLDLTLIRESNNQKHKNYLFSSGIDLIHELFNLERKLKTIFVNQLNILIRI